MPISPVHVLSAPVGSTLKAVLVALVNPDDVATRSYPLPAASIESAVKIAMPPDAPTGPPPNRVPAAGFVPMVRDTGLVAVGTTLENWSSIATLTGDMVRFWTTVLGCWMKASFVAAAGFTVTDAKPLMLPFARSVAATTALGAVNSVAPPVNVWVPLSPATKA